VKNCEREVVFTQGLALNDCKGCFRAAELIQGCQCPYLNSDTVVVGFVIIKALSLTLDYCCYTSLMETTEYFECTDFITHDPFGRAFGLVNGKLLRLTPFK
jgi:hypothetical protein